MGSSNGSLTRRAVIKTGLLTLVGGWVGFAGAPGAVAGTRPRVSFTEALSQDVRCIRDRKGLVECVPVTQGRFRGVARLPLDEVDLFDIDEGTPVYVRIGELVCHHYLGDDFGYTYGKRHARIVLREPGENGAAATPLVINLNWNRRNVVIAVSGRTPDFQEPLIADEFLGQQTKPIRTSTVASFAFGDIAADFTLDLRGRVSSYTRQLQEDYFVVSRVRLSGKASG